VGTNFLLFGFGRSSGDVIFDPTLPITDVKATIYTPVLGLGRTFGMLGRQALIVAALPYAWGDVNGKVFEQQESIRRSGLGDTKVKLSVNLRGSPAMHIPQFMKTPHRNMIIGASLTFSVPTGQYDPTKLINLGTNRWAFKPEIGVSFPIKKLDLDVYAASWFFTGNPQFYTGQKYRSQQPLPSIQAHVSYNVRTRLWVAFDTTWYTGGSATVDDGPPSERQNNSRVGVTVSLPLMKTQSLKVAYSAGAIARVGSNFKSLSVAWQYVWFDKATKRP
jgi:hypothetical protein